MTGEKQVATPKTKDISKQQVTEYLRKHPAFFKDNAELFEFMTPPEVDHGGNVVDLQHHMLGKLQKGLQSLKGKYDGLVVSSRDNMSTLHQVHEAALSLIRAPGLEQLLEVIAMDLPALFNVDIVRLCIESEAAEFYENKFGEQNVSGVAFLEQGLIDKALGKGKSIMLIADTSKQFVYGFEQIFSDCSGITESSALLRMRLPSTQRGVLLAFGVRIKDHFHEGQGTEMLSFLAQIVEHRLDQCLSDSGIAHLI
jgi:uncharacterized protein YigA (DUF484 family)